MFPVFLVHLNVADLHSGFEGMPAMSPGQVVDPRKRVAHVDAGVIVVLSDKSRPGPRRNRNLINNPGVTVVVLVVGGAIEACLGLVHEVGIEDVQQFQRAIDRRGDLLLQVRRGSRKRLRID